VNRFRIVALLPVLALLGGCNFVVLHPAGFVAEQQRDLVIISTLLMLVIIIPVMALTVLFAWRYRAANKKANYQPDWDHSTGLELVIWAAPLLIIICLGAITWMGTHLLDPYRRLEKIAANTPVAKDVKPLEVQVVALDWKWLFIYPEQGVATVNELAAPVNRPVHFRITASSVMNSFYIPALAGQIYAMPAMQTQLHAVINHPGNYKGFSANYSGAGFSGMHFRFHGMDDAGFETWVNEAKASGSRLDRAAYMQLERPSENVPVQKFGKVEQGIFDLIRNMCVEPGRMCMSEMMALDAGGGLGLAGIHATLPLPRDYRARVRSGDRVIASICTPDEAEQMASRAPPVAPVRSSTAITGFGLPHPGSIFRRSEPTPRGMQTARPTNS